MLGDVGVQQDAAETGRLAEALQRITPALERFNRFDTPDRAALDRADYLARLDVPLPERGAGLDAVLDELAEVVIPYGNRVGAPGFCGWVKSQPTTVGAAAVVAAAVAGPLRTCLHAFNGLEDISVRWLAELLGLPEEWQGVLVSGGSTANLVGLGAARQAAYEAIGIDASGAGLAGAPPGRVYGSDEVHHVVHRACGVLGLGRRGVVALPARRDGTLDPDDVDRALTADRRAGLVPVAVVASAGTVNQGAIDPFAALADVAEAHDTWLHVDGAYGLFGVLDPRISDRYAGLERASSAAVDPHKWLAVPVGVGVAYVRDRRLLARTFTMEPTEYIDGAFVSPVGARSPFDALGTPHHDFALELTSPSRGALVWAALAEIGAEGMRERVVRHCSFARRLAELVEADPRLELLSPPTLSICTFRYVAPGLAPRRLDDLNARIASELRAEGRVVPSTTTIAGAYAIRPCFINPRTTTAEIEELAASARRLGDALSRD